LYSALRLASKCSYFCWVLWIISARCVSSWFFAIVPATGVCLATKTPRPAARSSPVPNGRRAGAKKAAEAAERAPLSRVSLSHPCVVILLSVLGPAAPAARAKTPPHAVAGTPPQLHTHTPSHTHARTRKAPRRPRAAHTHTQTPPALGPQSVCALYFLPAVIFFSCGLRTWKEHMSDSSIDIIAPALSYSSQ